MKQTTNSLVLKDLVLIGGGHSHVAVLRRLGMNPLPGLRVTLIARDIHTPYSGMLPGYIASHYGYDNSHIDLRPLVQFAGARLYHCEVEGLDLTNQQVFCPGRPPVRFDLLSINIGSRPHSVGIPGAAEFALPVKPIDDFLTGWNRIVARVLASERRFRIAVVGGGAGGVELALATQYRLRSLLQAQGRAIEDLEHHLVANTDEIMPTHNPGVRQRFARVLRERGIRLHTGARVERVEGHGLYCRHGGFIPADAILWVTHATAPAWPRESGLTTDAQGFIRVNDYLQSVSHREVFAAGDIATMVDYPRPKSGVFAVRQGPPLTENLRRAALGRALKPFKPQTQFLGLISTGDQYAIASRGNWSLEGHWVWRIKDWIDRRFMGQYNQLPEMLSTSRLNIDTGLVGQEAIKELSAIAMRCGGCGAKVGSTVLARVMNRLSPVERDDVLIGLKEPDDAAVVEVPSGRLMVQSVDYFRAFLDDPYLFGKIAANHSLGDIFAMGAQPQSAMAIATLPYGREAMVEEQLYQLMAGALEVLNTAHTALVGGHSSEGAELSFGLAISGLAERSALLRKGGMRPGEVLILTKPLGTGTLFAADMRHKAKGRWIDAAIESMLVSNQAAAQCLHRYGASACTDVTGFGLLGHLVEMIRPVKVDVDLDLDALPVLDGALETIHMGIFSSLQPENVRLRRAIQDLDAASKHERYPILFDPQTAGGLLASLPSDRAKACLEELHRLGYTEARIIGQVHAPGAVAEPIRLMAHSLSH
jgi:selenide,water dikinase